MKMNGRRRFYGRITLGKAGFFVKIALCAVVVCLLITSFSLLMEYNRLGNTESKLEAEISEAEVRAAEPMDREYIMRVARKRLGLVLPDEIVYYTDLESQGK